MKKTITAFGFILFCCVSMTAQTPNITQSTYDGLDFNYISSMANSGYLNANIINGSDNENNLLRSGRVVIYKTSEGRYGKFEVQEYGYNLTIRWTTYNNNGTTYTSGNNLVITGTYLCDLDLGQKTQTSADFWWNQMTKVERYLEPKNNAVFYLISAKAKVKNPAPVVTKVPTENPPAAGDDKIVGTDAQGRTIYAGPRGGQYYINENGNKSYIKMDKTDSQPAASQPKVLVGKPKVPDPTLDDRLIGKNQKGFSIYETPLKGQYYIDSLGRKIYTIRDQNPKIFAPKGTITNSAAYYQTDFNTIKAAEDKMGQSKDFGGMEGSPLNLKAGSLFFYKTSKDNFGKMQIMAFGKGRFPAELYIRWTTFKKDGSVLKANEYHDLFAISGYDLDDSAFSSNDFTWSVKDNLLFITAQKDAKFYLADDGESVSSNTSSKTNNTDIQPNITWQGPLSNNSTTNNPTLDLKACVETSETVKEYILVQNGVKMAISRGLIARKNGDCLNAFNQTVTLKNGQNTFYILTQNLKSEAFTVFYNPNTKPTQGTIAETKIEKRIALVIGNADYTEGSKLKNPVNDANLITQTLKSLGFKVMQFNNLNKVQFERAIRDFSGVLSEYNVALFYYAGHGVQVDGENYLLPIDAKLQDKKDVRFEAVKVRFAVEEFENHPDNVNIVILDACRNNPFRSWARGSAEGFKPMNIGGTLVAFATAPDATASDGTNTNGLYTEELAKQMLVTQPLEAVFRETRKNVLMRSNRSQNPQEWSQLTQSFYFKK